MHPRLLAFALLGTVLLSCASGLPQPGAEMPVPTGDDSAPSVPLGQPFELAIGGTATITETGLQLAFRRVVEDSRCPAGVACVWAGRVTVELDAQAPDTAAETFALSSCCPAADTSHYLYAGQSIDLLNLNPGRPRPENAIAEGEYRLEVTVSAI